MSFSPPILTRLEELKRAGVMMVMVVREFICRRITPLQRDSRPMWTFTGPRDPMRIQVFPHPPDMLRELLRRLTGGNPDELPVNGLPLFQFQASESLVGEMPLFTNGVSAMGGMRAPEGPRPMGFKPS